MKEAHTKTREKRGIPGFLKRYFWETDLPRLDSRKHQFYLIERLIEYGDDRAIQWLRQNYTPAQIAAVVQSSRAISPNTANLWALILNIPRGKIQCFSRRSLLPHSAFSTG